MQNSLNDAVSFGERDREFCSLGACVRQLKASAMAADQLCRNREAKP